MPDDLRCGFGQQGYKVTLVCGSKGFQPPLSPCSSRLTRGFRSRRLALDSGAGVTAVSEVHDTLMTRAEWVGGCHLGGSECVGLRACVCGSDLYNATLMLFCVRVRTFL